MNTKYETRYAVSPNEAATMNTIQLRNTFLVNEIFQEGKINWTYSHFDRFMVGGAMPGIGRLSLEAIDPLKSAYFLERRELGIINVGNKGLVIVDGEEFELDFKEALYIGRGHAKIEFSNSDPVKSAKFYLNSATAHASYPNKKIARTDADSVIVGSSETANHRTVNKMIVASVVKTCQLQMGLTELKPGSIWNTMPPHTHDRRMEVYFYFGLPEGNSVCHFMGTPQESRHLWIQNEQAVIVPEWSIHSGAGTSNYSFIWGMAGENLDYGDMDQVAIRDLK
ncbi:MAG: 5-dehydro-4-deoxy-D-glucuronate isomerase [Bacteroidetes bacterium]|nr:MAG: 5-dehydro-4-deoxy-D-glucuronate isomerase [Bacteroidota bacterium]